MFLFRASAYEHAIEIALDAHDVVFVLVIEVYISFSAVDEVW